MHTPWLQRIWSHRRGEPCPGAEADAVETGHCSRVEIHLDHHVEVSEATERLLLLLDCDGWFVACRHDHQTVIRLTKGSVARYVICFQCTPEVEKAVYHGSRAWALSILPLRPEDNLTAAQAQAVQTVF